jgi:hypothetical protein
MNSQGVRLLEQVRLKRFIGIVFLRLLLDLSPIQPRYVPPNLHFEVDDYELDWVYKEKFDYIHIRYLMGAVKDWTVLFRKAYK